MRKKLAKWPLALAGVIFVFGVVAFVAVILIGIGEMGRGVFRLRVPGEGQFPLEPGSYVIFHEHVSDLDGEKTKAPERTVIDCSVTGPTGENVVVTGMTGHVTYTFNDREGTSIHRFEATTAGTYTLKAGHPSGDGPRTVISVSKEMEGKILKTTFVSFAVLFGCIGIAFVIAAITLLRWAFS